MTTRNSQSELPLHFLTIVDQIGDRLGWNVPPLIQVGELRQLPPGSLGYSLVEFLDQHQLQPFTTGPRRKQLHDSIHVLTGYDTDLMGEAEVQAFLLGSKFRLTHVLLGLGILRLIAKRCPSHPHLWLRLQRAYWRGRTSTFDLDRWHPETQWTLPLAQVQQRFHL